MNVPEKKQKNKILTIFGITFVIAFVVIFQVAKMISPSVDVEIGSDDSNDAGSTEKEDNVKKMIDERLKWIQFEDNAKENSKTKDENKEDDASSKKTEESVMQDSDELFKSDATVEVPKTEFEPITAQKKQEPAPEARVHKVYIGEYATIEQAMAAQDQVIELNLGVTPYIKGVNGKFVLQAGSFASKDKATSLASELIKNGLSAQIVQE